MLYISRIKLVFISLVTLLQLLTLPYSSGQSFKFTQYTISDGLVQSYITDICQDHFGNLWIATQGGGVSKFNGIEFSNLTVRDGLASNYIRSVVVGKNGDVWMATAEGVSKYDGKKIKNYSNSSVEESKKSVNKIFEDSKGDIWFSSPNGGLSRISIEDEITYFNGENGFTNDKVIDIDEDSHGNLWIVTRSDGLYKKSKGAFEKVVGANDIRGFILSAFLDGDTILLGTPNGLVEFNALQPSLDKKILEGSEGIFVKEVVKGVHGALWIISGGGVLKLENGKVKPIGNLEGFTNESVSTIFKDREGVIWLGTNGDGFYKYQGDFFSFFDTSHGLSNNAVTSILADNDGDYWFCTSGGGISKFDGEGFTSYSTQNTLTNNYVSSAVKDHDGNLWFGSKGGIHKFEKGEFVTFTTDDGLVNNSTRQLFVDAKNNLWVSTMIGLSRFDGHQFENFFEKEGGLYDNVIWGFIQLTKEKLLIVTRKGFNIYEGGEIKPYYNNPEIFKNRLNTVIFGPDSHFWIGYSGFGVCRLSLESGLLDCYTVDDGLASDLIHNLVFDKEGNLLVGTERGVDKLIFNEDRTLLNVKNYIEEGFAGIETNLYATYKQDDGDIWFGTKNGVYKYSPNKELVNGVEPRSYVTDVKLFYNQVDWEREGFEVSKWFSIPKNLVLPYNQNNIVINYFGNSLKNSKNVSYQFRLGNFEKSWSPITYNRSAAYTNIPPGKYTFEVKAANSDGVWGEVDNSFSFEIVPPFWKREWFYLLCILLFFWIIKLIYDFRIRTKLDHILTVEKIRVEEQVKVRKRMARDFHDNMGNQLASITVFTNLISLKLKDKSREVDDLLKNIEKHTKSLFNGTKDFIWSIDPESDHLLEVFTYIKDFGEDLFASTEIQFFSDAESLQETSYQLPSGWSRQIVLIFKEAMTNALKHAQCTEVQLEVILKKDEFVIRLLDNGTGIIKGKHMGGQGFKNMLSRANQIGCSLEVGESEAGSGVVVSFYGAFWQDERQKGYNGQQSKVASNGTLKTSVSQNK